MRSLNRRQFLTISIGAALLTQCRRGQTQDIFSQERQPKPLVKQPQVHRSQNGLLEMELEASYRQVQLGDKTVNLLSYNGQIPGPRLEVRPGDTVRIHFQNHLSTPTNLHFHGLHIPPTGSADNVFRRIGPEESFTYDFKIPDAHPAGSLYYHPHCHGYVADQILGGLGGILLVRNELDTLPEIQAAEEEFCFLKDFVVGQRQTHMGLIVGREGNLITVNGQQNPTFSMTPGGLKRFRFVNASNARFYRIALEKHALYLIASDGFSLPVPLERDELLLSPGERADVLVRGDQSPGSYQWLNLPYDRGMMGMMGSSGMMSGRGPGMMGGPQGFGHPGPGRMHGQRPNWQEANNTTLATLTYGGDRPSLPLPLPKQLVSLEDPPAPMVQRQFQLHHGRVPGEGMVFLINGRSFDPKRVDTQVVLNTVEDWEITNTGVMDHPFHLHTNAFQLLERNGQSLSPPLWKDTVLIPAGESIRIRIPFKDFVGQTVYHCHILDHEELGMMGVIEMKPEK